jgi:hypothetical protein
MNNNLKLVIILTKIMRHLHEYQLDVGCYIDKYNEIHKIGEPLFITIRCINPNSNIMSHV